MKKSNNVPLYAEEVKIEERSIEDILVKLQQIIPIDFVKLETVNRNYQCSTQSWKEPVCERYGFSYEGKWVQIDIPHTLLEELDLKKGEDIPYLIYLSPEVLNKELNFGAITIENEEEIFIQKPLTERNLGKELKRWLTEIESLKRQIQKLEEEKKLSQETISNFQSEQDNSNNRLAELDQLLKGSSLILKNQLVYIRRLKNQLIQEKNQVANSTEYNNNLRQDLLNLAKERKELQTSVKSLREWKNQLKFNLVPFFWPNAFYTEDTPDVEVLVERVKSLIKDKDELSGELQEKGNKIRELENKKKDLEEKLMKVNDQEIVILEEEISSLRKEIADKESKCCKLKENLSIVDDEEIICGEDEEVRKKIDKLEEEIGKLKSKKADLMKKLEEISPLLYKINSLEEKIKHLNYLYSLETSLKGREVENHQYEEQLRITRNKYEQLEVKLEEVRSLIADNRMDKLRFLYKKGEI